MTSSYIPYQERLAHTEAHDKSLLWYKNRYNAVQSKYAKLAEMRGTEEALRAQLKQCHEEIKSLRGQVAEVNETLARQPSVFPTLTRGSGKGAGTGRPYSPEYEDMAIMLLATGVSVYRTARVLWLIQIRIHARVLS